MDRFRGLSTLFSFYTSDRKIVDDCKSIQNKMTNFKLSVGWDSGEIEENDEGKLYKNQIRAAADALRDSSIRRISSQKSECEPGCDTALGRAGRSASYENPSGGTVHDDDKEKCK